MAFGALPSWSQRGTVLVVFTLGHVAGKMLWFAVGTWQSRITWPWLRRWLDRAKTVASAHPAIGTGVMFTSAVASLPPFQLMAIAAGMVGASWRLFFVVAYVGRLVRFSAIASVPSLFGLS